MAAASTATPTPPAKLEVLADDTPPNNLQQANPAGPPLIDCIICMDSLPRSSRAALLCTHDVCLDCFAKYASISIHNCVAFPRCPEPDCKVAASDHLIASCVTSDDAQRMRKLRGLYPCRAKDGRRMWCVADGCNEPLPPPFIDIANHNNQPNANANANASGVRNTNPNRNSVNAPNTIIPYLNAPGNFNHNINTNPPPAPAGPPPTSACGKCGTQACLQCGALQHPGTPCAAPTVNLRQQRLYATYCVGRIAPCEQCGAHVERNGGCSQMVCGVCGHSFTFRPFTSIRQVQESIANTAGVVPPPPPNRRNGILAQGLAHRLRAHGPVNDILEHFDRIGRIERRRGLIGNARRRYPGGAYGRTGVPAPEPLQEGPRAAATREPRRQYLRTGMLPQPTRSTAPLGGWGGTVNGRRVPPAPLDYISDEDLDWYNEDLFPEIVLDEAAGGYGPEMRAVRRRSTETGTAGAANRNTPDAARRLAPIERPQRYDPREDGDYLNTRRALQQRRYDILEARASRRAREYMMMQDEERWLNEPDQYATRGAAVRGATSTAAAAREADVYNIGPRRRASTGATPNEFTPLAAIDRSLGLTETRPTVRRRTLSDLEGATMPPPAIRRRTNAEGARVAGRTTAGMANGRNVRFDETAVAPQERRVSRLLAAERRARFGRTYDQGPRRAFGNPHPDED